MKIHHVREYLFTGKRKTHFRTTCGKLRHMCTNLQITEIKQESTCKICNYKAI